MIVTGRRALGLLYLRYSIQRLAFSQTRLAGSSSTRPMSSTEGHLIFRRSVPSTGRRRIARRRRVRGAATAVVTTTSIGCTRCRFARVLFSVSNTTSTSTSTPSGILRIARIVVTISPRWERLFRRRTELMRSLLPTLAVVVARVRARARSRSSFMELAPSLLVSRSSYDSALGGRSVVRGGLARTNRRSMHRVSVLEYLVQRQLWRRH